MAGYGIIVGSGGSGPEKQLNEILDQVRDIDKLMDKLTDDVVLPILAEHYDSSGLKQGGSRTGNLKAAITKRGARGNVISKYGGKLVVGVSYSQIPYARWALEGRGEVHPKKGKVLHWIDPDTGKSIFAKHVGPAPAHPVFYLAPNDLDRLKDELILMILTKGGAS